MGIDLLELGSVVIFQRVGHEDRMGTITEWQQRSTFPKLRTNLTRWYAAQYASEAVAQLTEVHDAHPHLFDALAAMLEQLEAAEPMPVLTSFLWILLTEIGLRPELRRCIACGDAWDAATPILYFSSREGGVICRDCEPHIVEKMRIDGAAARSLIDDTMPSSPIVAKAFSLLDYHLRETIGRPLRLSAPLKASLQSHPISSA